MRIKVDSEDLEALVNIARAYRGETTGSHFVDRSRTTLRPFYAVAILNAQTALAESKRPKARSK
jgi:hypothetical protein